MAWTSCRRGVRSSLKKRCVHDNDSSSSTHPAQAVVCMPQPHGHVCFKAGDPVMRRSTLMRPLTNDFGPRLLACRLSRWLRWSSTTCRWRCCSGTTGGGCSHSFCSRPTMVASSTQSSLGAAPFPCPFSFLGCLFVHGRCTLSLACHSPCPSTSRPVSNLHRRPDPHAMPWCVFEICRLPIYLEKSKQVSTRLSLWALMVALTLFTIIVPLSGHFVCDSKVCTCFWRQPVSCHPTPFP